MNLAFNKTPTVKVIKTAKDMQGRIEIFCILRI